MTQVMLIRVALSLTLLVGIAGECRSETVDVKYRGPVDLAPFKCVAIDRSSFIRRVCYDAADGYMIVKLNETYYSPKFPPPPNFYRNPFQRENKLLGCFCS